MAASNPTTFTAQLRAWREGNQEAGAQVMVQVYQDLRRLAQQYLRQERAGHTLQATALVHEAYLRLFGEEQLEMESRAHFFVVAARQMRRILVDHARSAQAAKRDHHRTRRPLEEAANFAPDRYRELIALDEALSDLERLYPRAGRVVELRFFSGLSEQEAAGVLGISVATLKRDWAFAKTWLYGQVRRADK